MQDFSDRAEKDRSQYNEGLQRKGYERFFNHCRYFYIRKRTQLIKEKIKFAHNKKVLEIGSVTWKGWLESNSILPASLNCINISEIELQKGIDSAFKSRVNPQFLLMDAHKLQFEDESFDFVFGGAILHHLNMVTILNEIHRVLKPNGKILFVEPLDMNPMGKIVRSLRRKARTVDEQPLRVCDIVEIKKRFETQFFYEEFLSVPFGVLSGMFFKDGSNSLMRFAFSADQILDRNFEWIRNWFRHVLIDGVRK